MPRIGFITERMLRGFGVDLVVDQLARGLGARGHEVTVYASVSDGTFEPEGYRLKSIPTPASSWFPLCDLLAQRHLSFLNGEGNDAWLVHTPPFFSLLPRLAAPAIAVDYGVSSSAGFPLKIRANFAYVRWSQDHVFWRWAKAIAPISNFLRRDLPPRLKQKAEVIYLGADHYRSLAGSVDDESVRRELGIGSDEVLLLYVGRLASADQPYKGTAELVETWRWLHRQNPKLRLLMAGFGGERERKWLEEQGISVITNAATERMPSIFAACDVYVTASRWEGFDLPLLEAQSFGKPVVALNIGAHPEVVADGESGFLVDNMNDLGKAVLALAADKDLRSLMGAAALRQAERFKWENTVAAYDRLIGDVMAITS